DGVALRTSLCLRLESRFAAWIQELYSKLARAVGEDFLEWNASLRRNEARIFMLSLVTAEQVRVQRSRLAPGAAGGPEGQPDALHAACSRAAPGAAPRAGGFADFSFGVPGCVSSSSTSPAGGPQLCEFDDRSARHLQDAEARLTQEAQRCQVALGSEDVRAAEAWVVGLFSPQVGYAQEWPCAGVASGAGSSG
ncbi:unnamed protein product, partial [Prorocentrum cordatum]